jgi:predicted acetyltransferase
MGIEIRAAHADEFDDAIRAGAASWGHHAHEDDLEDARILAEPGRTLVAFDRGRPVGVAAAVSFELTVPGGATVAAAGLTDVGVLPTHRRRGILTALLARHREASQARGETATVLVASEGTIYDRFGFGAAVLAMAVEIDTAGAAFTTHRPADAGATGELRLVDTDEAAVMLPGAYDRYRRQQPGEISRDARFWQVQLHDRERWRDGASARFVVVHEAPEGPDEDRVDGYVSYRMRAAWPQGLPAFGLDVEEVVAASPAVRAALWRYVLDLDLVSTVRAWSLPVDDPLRWLLADPRALRVTALRDMLWLRLIDVPGALAARRDASAGRLVIEVVAAGDDRDGRPGRYLVEGGPDGAACRACPEQLPELSLRASDLGALFLGGVRPSTLGRAGRVVELEPGALARADTLLLSDPLPHCLTDF